MNKNQYDYHRREGVKWLEYCEMFPGILSFILSQTELFQIPLTEWVGPGAEGIGSLRCYINPEYLSAICNAGKAFEDSLDLTANDFEFVGENKSLDEA